MLLISAARVGWRGSQISGATLATEGTARNTLPWRKTTTRNSNLQPCRAWAGARTPNMLPLVVMMAIVEELAAFASMVWWVMHHRIPRQVPHALRSLRDSSEPHPFSDGIAWIKNDPVTGLEANQNLSEALIAVAYRHHRPPSASVRCH